LEKEGFPVTEVAHNKTLSVENTPKKPKIIVTMPAYRAERTLSKTLYDIPLGFADEVILVDDASPDNTVRVAQELGIKVIAHQSNRGYGGNQKTCYDHALARGADIVVLLHPDYQYSPKVLPDLVQPLLEGRADFTFGSRFINGGKPMQGGMPLYRYVGNRFLTTFENTVLGTQFAELHSGLKAYTRRFLTELDYHRYDEAFVFDSEMLIEAVLLGYNIEEVSIPTRYAEDSSSTSINASLVYVAKSMEKVVKARISAGKVRKEHANRLKHKYSKFVSYSI
jgi:glycosyltransferase involved in cell wall biosynthesis